MRHDVNSRKFYSKTGESFFFCTRVYVEKFVFIRVVLVIVPNVLKLRVKAVLDLQVFAVQIKLVIDEQLSQTNLFKRNVCY